MVARINSSKSITRALLYNEQKVTCGQAECLCAHLFLKDPQQLTFSEKRHHLERLTSLNQRVVTNTVHLSLNFDARDALDKEKLVRIAKSYMHKIGFGAQPYLVYQHQDAGHPHLHVVSTNIRWDGSRIDLHNIGRVQSEKARKEIEWEWGLVKAKGRPQEQSLKPAYARKVAYGKTGTKEAISAVLQAVYPHYRYTTLAEYNAVLRLYNVVAERGSATSRMHQGIVYRVLDSQGKKIGTPIKASAFALQPTLKNLEARFCQNELLRQGSRQRLENKIHRVLQDQPFHLDVFQKRLEREGIHVVVSPIRNTLSSGIIYVDHTTKCVFQERALDPRYHSQKLQQEQVTRAGETKKMQQEIKPWDPVSQAASLNPGTDLLHTLLSPVSSSDILPHELKQQKKKRKRIYHHL